jgi:amino acid adenylation domain-containing protein
MNFNTLGTIIANNKRCDSDSIRYEMNRIKEMLSTYVVPGEIVGLALPRTEYILITVMALLECQIPFLAIDLNLPETRVKLMLKNAGVKKIVTTKGVSEELLAEYECLYIESEKKQGIAAADYSENELAYIIHTSGSTGQPKAVEVTKEGLACFLNAMPEKIPFIPGKAMACLSNYTFDIFFLEAVLALSKGLTVVIANEEEQSNPKRIIDLIERYDIKLLQMTPSKMKLIWLYDKELVCLNQAEAVMLGGEAFPKELLEFLKKKKNLKIYNLYGPTETTVWSAVSDLTRKEIIDIGEPLSYVKFYLLGEDLKPVSAGETGEIYIGGKGVAKGYRNNTEQTVQHFVKLPLEPGKTIYRTGDMACYDQDGFLVFMGRKDNQVKLRGHRIELEEIDANLMKLEDIKLSVTCFDQENQELIAFYISEEPIENSILQQHLKKFLPGHMIPGSYYRTKSFNYTDSGKVDRRSMLALAETLTTLECAEKVTESESTIGDKIFCDSVADRIIQIIKTNIKEKGREVTCKDNLSDLGVNSLSYIDIIVQFEDAFDIIIGDDKLYLTAFSNIGELKEYIDNLLAEKNQAVGVS